MKWSVFSNAGVLSVSAFRFLVILWLVVMLQKFLFAPRRRRIRFQDLGLMALAPTRGIIAYMMSLWIVSHKGRRHCGRNSGHSSQLFTGGDEETHKIVVYATVYFSLLHVPLARSLR